MTERVITHIARDCQSSISTFLDAVRLQHDSVKDFVSERDVTHIQERYDQWAGNLGALQPANSRISLEYRLCKSPVVREAILEKLEDLYSSLKAAINIAKGTRVNRVIAEIVATDADLVEYDISSSESDSTASSLSSSGINPQKKGMKVEIQELMSGIKLDIDYLFKISVFIRKSATNSKPREELTVKPFDNHADIMYVMDRYPIVTTKEKALAMRLGEANTRRRQYFKYRRDHNDRLSQPRVEMNPSQGLRKPQLPDQDVRPMRSALSDETSPTLLAETEVTTLLSSSFEKDQLATALNVEPAMSVVSFATSIVESSEDSLEFPPLPAEAQTSPSFVCPYCWTVVILNPGDQHHQWRRHILQDLEPYICTFPGCGLDTYHSRHSWFEHELMTHRTNWVCPRCSETFKSSDGLKSHISINHNQEISSNQVDAIVKQSRRQIQTISPSDCPLCDEDWASADSGTTSAGEILVVDLDQFQRHLGHHLQQIALFSLPRLNRDQGLGSNHAGAELGPEDQPRGLADCGRGWGIISRKRVVFMAFAFFLQLGGLKKCVQSQEEDFANGNLQWFPPHLKKEGLGWSIGFSPAVPQVLDIKLINKLYIHEAVTNIAFSPHGKHIAFGCGSTIQILDVVESKPIWTLQDDTRIRCFCFCPNGVNIVTGGFDHHVKLWEIGSSWKHTLITCASVVRSVDVSCDGNLAVAGCDDGTLHYFNIQKGRLFDAEVQMGGPVIAVAFSPDGHYAAAAIADSRYRGSLLCSSVTKAVSKSFETITPWITSIAFPPAGTYLYTSSDRSSADFWDLRPFLGGTKPIRRLTSPKGGASSITTIDGGTRLISGSIDRSIRIWNTATGDMEALLLGHDRPIFSVAASPTVSTGGLFASASLDNTINIWSYTRIEEEPRTT